MTNFGSEDKATAEQEGRGWSSLLPWGIAAVVVLALLLGLLIASRSAHGGAPAGATAHTREDDAYATHLSFGKLAMSESTSLSGGKSTFVDGTMRNDGDQAVTSVEVQVLFANDEALPPQTETLFVTPIRTHEPYIDTEPMSGHPVKSGEEREFRLIFEQIGANWNQQMPVIHVKRVFVACTSCR